ncbi:hypothetical protein [Fluviicola sp.]|uniref:hypothetical protein n=1 Tax=Fluviicola sp. TaxID=1917219 RepID=UPI003D2D78C9
MKNWILLIILFCFNSVFSQKEISKTYLRAASEIIDTTNFLYYPVKGDFEVRINKEEYIFTLESNLSSDKDCQYDYQYWEIKKNATENDLKKIMPEKFEYFLKYIVYNKLIDKHAVIWDKTSSSYIPYFFIRAYDDIGTSGEEIYVVRTNKSEEDYKLKEGFQQKYVIVQRVIRVY